MNESTAVIQVENLTKTYGSTTAVSGLSFCVQRGEIFGIVGPNGAGKTTTMECLAGMRRADNGRLSVLGLDPARQERELRKRLGVQLQQAALPEDLKVWEALDLFATIYHRPDGWKKLMQTWGLEEKRNARFGTLSGGQKQRLFIALSLVNDPELVFLDEITTGLDPQARRGTWELIEKLREHGKTVVLVTHYMDEAERLCDRVAIIDHGSLVALNTPAALIQNLHAETRIIFSADRRETYLWLNNVPGVSAVERQTQSVPDGHGNVVVTGSGPVLARVASALAERGIVPGDLRSQQATLEDVFLALTGSEIRA
jgi:ABC-2 type transport system ATP-binding protein